jgi:hypothetical protein
VYGRRFLPERNRNWQKAAYANENTDKFRTAPERHRVLTAAVLTFREKVNVWSIAYYRNIRATMPASFRLQPGNTEEARARPPLRRSAIQKFLQENGALNLVELNSYLGYMSSSIRSPDR